MNAVKATTKSLTLITDNYKGGTRGICSRLKKRSARLLNSMGSASVHTRSRTKPYMIMPTSACILKLNIFTSANELHFPQTEYLNGQVFCEKTPTFHTSSSFS